MSSELWCLRLCEVRRLLPSPFHFCPGSTVYFSELWYLLGSHSHPALKPLVVRSRASDQLSSFHAHIRSAQQMLLSPEKMYMEEKCFRYDAARYPRDTDGETRGGAGG